jgi:hypothetical protein
MRQENNPWPNQSRVALVAIHILEKTSGCCDLTLLREVWLGQAACGQRDIAREIDPKIETEFISRSKKLPPKQGICGARKTVILALRLGDHNDHNYFVIGSLRQAFWR